MPGEILQGNDLALSMGGRQCDYLTNGQASSIDFIVVVAPRLINAA